MKQLVISGLSAVSPRHADRTVTAVRSVRSVKSLRVFSPSITSITPVAFGCHAGISLQ